jgi:hypothetical protein
MRTQLTLKYPGQQGFVSLFTVIFFMLLITVITVGFLRIMAIEQRQAIDNDLTASALAAAESGVEDGKRALLAYYNESTSASLKSDLAGAFDSSNNSCDSLTSLSSVQTAIGITGQTVGGSGLNQGYTCLNVKLNSPDYLASAEANQSEIFPLRGTGTFDRIIISWHLLSESIGTEGDGKPSSLVPLASTQSLLPQTGGSQSWSSNGYPAYLRAQVFGYPNSSFTRADLSNLSRAVFLVSGSSSVIDLNAANQGAPNTNVQCGSSFTQYGTYLCSATLQLPAGSNNYYLRLTPIYGATHFKVQLYNSSAGSTVDMKDVQPIIDVTGHAADVYRRVQTRVRINAITGLPEYTLESANTICKNMWVADGSAGSWQVNTCP